MATAAPTTRGLAIADLLNPATPRPKRFKASDLTRDDRIRIRTLHDYGHTYREIVSNTTYTRAQVQRALNGPVTPQKNKPRKSRVITPHREQLRQWLEDGRNRFTPLYQLRYYVPPPLNLYGEA
ncbi:hypothetical protein C8A03DRAFT_39299, partial [Achaetomium macrosporum]